MSIKPKTKTDLLEAQIYNILGEKQKKTVLPREIFDAPVNKNVVAQAVRVYLANQRMGTHSTKTRSEVAGSTRKIYRQKGTGRARHGDAKAPIFIGGGLAFGARPRDYGLGLSKKMKKAALFAALTDKMKSEKIKVIAGMQEVEPKTKKIAEIIKKLGVSQLEKNSKIKILLITPPKSNNIFLAGRNIPNLTIIPSDALNTYAIINSTDLILMEEAIPVLKGHFIKEIKAKKENIEIKKTKTKKIVQKEIKAKAVRKTITKKRKIVKKK